MSLLNFQIIAYLILSYYTSLNQNKGVVSFRFALYPILAYEYAVQSENLLLFKYPRNSDRHYSSQFAQLLRLLSPQTSLSPSRTISRREWKYAESARRLGGTSWERLPSNSNAEFIFRYFAHVSLFFSNHRTLH